MIFFSLENATISLILVAWKSVFSASYESRRRRCVLSTLTSGCREIRQRRCFFIFRSSLSNLFVHSDGFSWQGGGIGRGGRGCSFVESLDPLLTWFQFESGKLFCISERRLQWTRQKNRKREKERGIKRRYDDRVIRGNTVLSSCF